MRKLTRNECEFAIAEHMKEIVKILHSYAPNSKYLTLCYGDRRDSKFEDFAGEYISFNNDNFKNRDIPEVEFQVTLTHIHDVVSADKTTTDLERVVSWLSEHSVAFEDFKIRFPEMADLIEEEE